jgi:hypothetical protein
VTRVSANRMLISGLGFKGYMSKCIVIYSLGKCDVKSLPDKEMAFNHTMLIFQSTSHQATLDCMSLISNQMGIK